MPHPAPIRCGTTRVAHPHGRPHAYAPLRVSVGTTRVLGTEREGCPGELYDWAEAAVYVFWLVQILLCCSCTSRYCNGAVSHLKASQRKSDAKKTDAMA